MATCQSCFKKMPDKATHCPHCGTAQHRAEVAKKTVFGYAAGAELQKLVQNQTTQPEGDALAKTMFAQGDSQPHPQQEPAPRQEPAFKPPNVRPLQIDPSLRTPLTDAAAHPPHVESSPPRPAMRVTAPQVATPGGTTPSAGYPATIGVAQPQPTGVPPTMASQAARPPNMPAPAAGPSVARATPVARPPAPHAVQVPRSAPRVGRVSAELYLAFIIAGIVISSGLTGLAVANLRHMHELLYFSWMPTIISAVFFFILLYKAWAALQDGYTPISAGKAVGFLFIPFFNIYWIFIAFGSWGKHYNLYAERNKIGGPRMSEGLFLAYPILCLVPIANIAAPMVAIIVIVKFCQGINAIASA